MIDTIGSSSRGRRRLASGNALVEYATPIAVIIIASIGALAALGVGLNGQFGLAKKNMSAKINNAQAQIQLHDSQKNSFQAAGSSTIKTGSAVHSGTYSTAGLSINDISQMIQTAGANGVTEALADALTSYINQLKGDSNLSPDQINILTQLANAGHNMASAEKALQDAVNSGQSSVTFNGQTYSVSDFTQQFGFNNSVGINATNSMSAADAMPQLAPFMNLYSQAQSSGALSDPAVNDQITYLSKQIAALSDLAKWNTQTSPQDLTSAYVTAMQQLSISNTPPSISAATNTNSAGICTTGSGSDTGTACN